MNLAIEASLQDAIDQERRQANYMGENPLPASNFQNLSSATADTQAASSSSVIDPPTQYSMTMNLVTDLGMRPAPSVMAPKLATRPDAPDWAKIPQPQAPVKEMHPKRPLPVGQLPTAMAAFVPVIPVKKPPPLLPKAAPPKRGKYGNLLPNNPPTKPFPKPKTIYY